MSLDTVAAIARPAGAAKPARTKHGFANNNEWRRLYFQSRRIAELHRLFRHRYGAEFYEFPEGDDSGWQDLVILLSHYCVVDPGRVPVVIKTRAPWIVGTEQEAVLYAEVSKNADAKLPTAAELAEIMNLTEAERVKLGIRTIGAVDVTPAQRKAKRKKSHRDRMRAVRRAKGVVSRDEFLSKAKTTTKPWEIEGISRRTWYRRQNGTGVCAVSKNKEDTNTEHGPVPHGTGCSAVSKKDAAGKTPDNVVILNPATSRRGLGHGRNSQAPGQHRTNVRKKAA